MTELDIRPANPSDARDLAIIHVDSWRAAYAGIVPEAKLNSLSHDKREKSFHSSISDGPEETWIAEQGDKPVGFATIGPCRDEDTAPSVTGEIWGIYLRPCNRRAGIGSHLCSYVEKLLAVRGYKTIKLWVLRDNSSARRFYEHMGYETDGTEQVLNIGKPLTAVRYEKRV